MRLLVLILALAATLASPALAVNPYCVAGSGVLTKLGMPAECTDYNWNSLRTGAVIQMVRPNHYYNYIGISPNWFHYNELTDQINDLAQFQAWVTANPGKIWIIGNEPDLNSQDGLTKDQYVHMFRKYHDTITAIDPSAKFCIGAITGGSTTDGLNYTKAWYQDVLNLYKTTYGGAQMPIDIWNIHSYIGPKQIEDPGKIINDFVAPFVTWCHTVDGGAYAGCPVWITEFPIGEWNGALSEENVVWFMQRYCPRLENAGIERFFWYVSSDWDGSQGSCPLVRSNQPTSVGQAYAALANSYPNAVPPVTPYVPDPTPNWHVSDFSGALASPWMNKGGYWSFTGGELRHTGIYPWNGTTCVLQHLYQDSNVSFRMKISSASDPSYWAGVVLRVTSRYHTAWDSGYMFFVRKNGEASLYNATEGVVATVAGAVSDPENYHQYRVQIAGSRIRVYIDGILKLDWTDPSNRFTSAGYTIVQAHRTDCSYDDFHVLNGAIPNPTVTDDGSYTTELDHLHASWTAHDPGCGIQGYYYAIGTTPGGTDALGWTWTTDTSIDRAIPLTAGTMYYVSVRTIYTDGFESASVSSNGIIAAADASTIRDLKNLASSTYALVTGKVVSGVFPDGFFIQEPDRSVGIFVKTPLAVQVGDVVTLTGRVVVSDRQAVLDQAALISGSPGQEPKPLGMTTRSTGGAACGLQEAQVDDAATGRLAQGLSPTGLLVRLAGSVSFVDPGGSYAYIDDGRSISDGSGHPGVKTSLDGLLVPLTGSRAQVTACCSATDVNGRCARLLRPRSAQDAQFSAVLNSLANAGFESGQFSPWVRNGASGSVRSGTWYYSISACSGSYFFGVYGNNATRSGVLTQTVSLSAGSYRASVQSRVLHGNNAEDAARNRIGIDPTGGTDPTAASVQWSEWDMQSQWYTSEWRLLTTPSVSTAGGAATVFLEYSQQDTNGWHTNCFDDARVYEF